MASSSRTIPAAPVGPLASLPAHLSCLLEGPSIMHLCTRSAALQPMSTIAFGLHTGGARPEAPVKSGESTVSEVTVFLPAALAPMMLANLRDNGEMALTIVRPTDHRAIQIKGSWLGERRTDEADRLFIEGYREALTQELGLVGVPRSLWRRVICWPSLALRMEVRDVFVQTPGPGAGRRCDSAAGAGAP